MMKHRCRSAAAPLLLLLTAAAAALAPAQVADYANSGYKSTEGRARVAGTLAAHDREQTQKPKELVASLGLKPGDAVADIGTGVGFMLPYLREAVGREGRVYAEDIFKDFLDKAIARSTEKNLEVAFIHGDEKDSRLPEASVNLALVLDVYHHFDYPAEMLASIAKGLKPGGRLAIVDFYKQGFRDPKHIRLDEKEMIAEVEANGFKLNKSGPFTEGRQYLAIFTKK